MKRRAAAVALALAVPLVLGTAVVAAQNRPAGKASSADASSTLTLDGAGANSIEPFFSKVFYDYQQAHPKVTINYSPAGSSVGVSDIQQDTVAFGDSEIPMAAKDLAKAKGTVLQVPVDLGGVAISYNLPGVKSGLKLTGPTLAGIFEGLITNWDSPQIASVTGDDNLPNLPIVPVHRADSSGPGWDLDEYLIQNSSNWVAKIGTSTPSKTWPLPKVGVGEQLNSGVASYISQTAGAIGFVEYGYALEANFTNAALINKSGDFVAPTQASIALAGVARHQANGGQLRHHRRARRRHVPASQLQLDPALSKTVGCVYRRRAAAHFHVRHNDGPAPSGQVGLRTSPDVRCRPLEGDTGAAGKLSRQTSFGVGVTFWRK